jgi:hypothetical protein
MPVSSHPSCAGLPFKGDLGELVLGNAYGPTNFAQLRAQVLHLCNRHARVVGNHHDARAFEDLAEFIDHFLFLGSIHSFTPSVGVSPRLMFAPFGGVRVRSGSRGQDRPRKPPEPSVSFPISGRRLSPGRLRPPAVSDRTGRFRPVVPAPPFCLACGAARTPEFVGCVLARTAPPVSCRRRRQIDRSRPGPWSRTATPSSGRCPWPPWAWRG